VNDVTLCVINHNGLQHLQTLWQALQPWASRCAEILVIDNASEDGSVAFVQALAGVHCLRLASNRGPAGARNLGFRLARYPRILFLDNDVVPTEVVLERLQADLDAHPDALLVAPRVCYASEPARIQYDSADCHLLGLMSLRHANRLVADCPPNLSRTTSLVTACFLIDRQRWQQRVENLNLFEERLIFNFEDHDFGVRASLLGFDLLCDSRATVLHGAGTAGQSWRPGGAVPRQRLFCLCRNRWWIVLRYFSAPTLMILLPFLLAFEALQLAGLVVRGHGRVWLDALGSTLVQAPWLWRQRRHWQRLRRRPDRAILVPGPLPLTTTWTSGSVAARLLGAFDHLLTRWSRWLNWSVPAREVAP